MTAQQKGAESEEQNQLYILTPQTLVVEAESRAEAEELGVEQMEEGRVGIDNAEEVGE